MSPIRIEEEKKGKKEEMFEAIEEPNLPTYILNAEALSTEEANIVKFG